MPGTAPIYGAVPAQAPAPLAPLLPLVPYALAFFVGGGLCLLAQLVVDLTPLNPARTMVLAVSLGAVLSGLGLWGPLVKLAGAGASVPLLGFGHVLVQGIIGDISRHGWVGILGGGLEAAAIGVSTAVVLGYLMALLFRPRG